MKSSRPLRALFVLLAFLPLAFAATREGPQPLARPAIEVSVGDAALVERIVALGRDDSRVQEHLRILTRRYGPRLTSSPVLEEAQRWALATFESLGLEARLERWGEFPVGFWRGPAEGRAVAPEGRELEFITSAWSAGTIGPIRGRALLEPRDFDELAALAPHLAGAFVLRPRLDREAQQEREQQLAEEGDEESGRRRLRELGQAFEAACSEAGIAGTLRPGASDGRLVTSGSWRVDPEKLPRDLRVTLRHDQFEELAEWIAEGREVVLEFDVDNRFLPGPIALHNVVADLRGRELEDEYVIVQAHIDSWDGAEGACDNGTGVATTLEAARLLVEAGVRPRRTIRFVLYSGEEQGLLGSRGYVRDHADELPRTSIVLNHDNGTNHLKGIQATEAMLADFERVFAPVRALDPERPFELLRVEGLRPGGSSDHAPFVGAGVPAFHWIQDWSGYSHIHHTQHDVFDAAIPEEQQHSALVVALAAYGFAELEGLLDRTAMLAPPPRRMGVMLDGARITRVTPGMRAARAGWLEDDLIVSIDGVAVDSRQSVSAELQKGGPQKVFVLRRGEETFESVLDYGEESEDEAGAAPAEGRRGGRRGGV